MLVLVVMEMKAKMQGCKISADIFHVQYQIWILTAVSFVNNQCHNSEH